MAIVRRPSGPSRISRSNSKASLSRSGERPPGIAVRHGDQMIHCPVFELQGQPAQTALRVDDSALDNLSEIVFGQRFQHNYPAPRKERRNDLEGGVLGRGADQGEEPALHVRQKGVLLTFVEAVDFVDEENGLLSGLTVLGRLGDNLPDFLYAGEDSREGDKEGIGGAGENVGQGSLPGARRSPED